MEPNELIPKMNDEEQERLAKRNILRDGIKLSAVLMACANIADEMHSGARLGNDIKTVALRMRIKELGGNPYSP